MKRAWIIWVGSMLIAASVSAGAQTDTNVPASNSVPLSGSPVIIPGQNPPPSAANSFTLPASGAAAAPAAGAGPKDEIYDIRPPIFFLRSWLWLWVVLGALAFAGLVVLLWRWFGGRNERKARTAYDLTLEKLEQARLLMNESDPSPYAVAVSEAIRGYLGQRFHAPSARRTTDEFLRQMQSDAGAPLAEHQALLGEFLQSCDLVKFARYQPTLDELEKVQQRAVTFVTATKPAPVSAENGAAS